MERRVFGELLNFRNLKHAPVNELGVVFLFGLLHESLGLHVESIRSSYPDCYAKRELSDGKWEEVRIEFEYESRNFKAHKHDSEMVDMIVCWKHNWPQCPDHIEVVEFSSIISDGLPNFRPPRITPRLSEWQKYCQAKRLEGYSFGEIAKMWKARD